MKMQVFDTRPCSLGEGPLWHPERGQFFWFDINAPALLSEGGQEWRFNEQVSAAGWVDRDTLLIASESQLMTFDLTSGATAQVCALEADNPATRSNDGRADPYGGFWIGTMGKRGEPGAGAFYRYYKGEVRCLMGDVTIPNALCFAPEGDRAYLADTDKGQILRWRLNPSDGWPIGAPDVLCDPGAEGFKPDGAVVDQGGIIWNAQYGAGRVAAYDPSGLFQYAIALDAPQATCPAFGGSDLRTLFCTSAHQGMGTESRARHPLSGQTFYREDVAPGQAEHRVIL